MTLDDAVEDRDVRLDNIAVKYHPGLRRSVVDEVVGIVLGAVILAFEV
jgi:hypothetical protein